MNIGLARRFGNSWIDNHHRTLGITGDFVDYLAGLREAVRLPWIGADEEHVVGMVDVFRRMAGLPPEELAVEPETAGFFLRERSVDIARADGRA